MGSANGCCKNPQVEQNVVKQQNGVGKNWVDANGHDRSQSHGHPTLTQINDPKVQRGHDTIVGGHVNPAYDGGPGGGGGGGRGPPPTIYIPPPPTTGCQNQPKIEKKMATLQIQKPAPQFKGTAVVDGQFKDISLADYKGQYVVLFFYPLDFTFVCPTEIIAFSEAADKFRDINCQVIAASTDSHFSHFAWVTTPRKQGGLGQMNIPLLADKTGDIAKSYGIYKEDEGIAFRGLFIIDGKQNLRQITVNDLPVGRSVEETLRLVQAFQFTDKHGEVCPAGWKPGDKTIKPNIADSKAFFESS